ncbi:MAG: ABC-2 family transporter protein, partial [Anaerolineae bacterium]|nr:ABC-2 family transporter protein [Anaerolineae bacterium]
NLQNRLIYFWDVAVNSLLIVLFIFVFAQLWGATFEAQGEAAIAGLTLTQTVWYFVWAEMLMIGKIRHIDTVSQEVRDGSLAYTLGRPYNYLLYHFAYGVGESMVAMTVLLVFGGLVAWSQVGPLASFRLETLPGLLLVTALAFVLDFLVMSIIALLAFFFEDVQSFQFIYHKIVFVLGGLLIPVDFLPEWLQGIARALPFNLAVYAPSKLFVAWDGDQFWYSLIMQVIWIGVMALAVTTLFRYGARRVSINGG